MRPRHVRRPCLHLISCTLACVPHTRCPPQQNALQIICTPAAIVLRGLSEPAKAAGITLEVIGVPKGTPGDEQAQQFLEFIKAAGAIGGLPKIKQQGPLHDAFAAQLAASGLQVADASTALAVLLAVHEDARKDTTGAKKAGFLTSSIMQKALAHIETFIDNRRPVKHSALRDDINDRIADPAKSGIKLKADLCEVAYLPVVCSGGRFELRVGAECDGAKLHAGVLLVHFGAKYAQRIANICRTYFFNPNPACAPGVSSVCAVLIGGYARFVPVVARHALGMALPLARMLQFPS